PMTMPLSLPCSFVPLFPAPLPNDSEQPRARACPDEALGVMARYLDASRREYAAGRPLHVLLDRVPRDLGVRIPHARDDLVPRAAVRRAVRRDDVVQLVILFLVDQSAQQGREQLELVARDFG